MTERTRVGYIFLRRSLFVGNTMLLHKNRKRRHMKTKDDVHLYIFDEPRIPAALFCTCSPFRRKQSHVLPIRNTKII